VVGSGLSPNGVGFSGEGMLSMALLDKVLWVDPDSQLVSECWGFLGGGVWAAREGGT
jgi:hypothetical protein